LTDTEKGIILPFEKRFLIGPKKRRREFMQYDAKDLKMRLSILMIIVVGFLAAGTVLGWQYYKNLGGGLDDARDIDICADGGFFIAGRSNAWALGGFEDNWYDHEFFLIKLDSLGNEEWIRHYGELGEGFYDAAWGVCATPDSGCILCGKTQSPKWVDVPFGYTTWYDDVLLVRVDKFGDTLWTKSYDGDDRFDRAWWIKNIPGSNDFFFTGPITVNPDGFADIWIMRIDSVGNTIADVVWTDSTRDGHADVRWGAITPDGGCIVVGSSDLRDTSYYYAPYDSIVTHRISRALVIKTDSLCNILWTKTYDTGCSDHYSRSITACPGGGYLMTTYNKWPAWTWCLRLDEDGDTLWTDYVGLDPADSTSRLANFSMVINAPGGGFYFAGSGQGWAWITKTDDYCNELWSVPLDLGGYTELFLNCVATPDGGCCACGQTYSVYPSAYSDILAMRVNRWGEDYYGVPEVASARPEEIEIRAYPNPFNSAVNIRVLGLGARGSAVEVFDINGRMVEEIPVNWSDSEKPSSTTASCVCRWSPSEGTHSGTFFIRIDNGKSVASRKIVYLR